MAATRIELSLSSDAAAMIFVRTLMEKAAELCGFDEKQAGGIVLAVDEACTNVIRHQYDGRGDGRIDLTAEVDEAAAALRIIIRDYGPLRDAALFHGRRLDEVRPGGLGLHLIRQVMDEVKYSAAEGGGMRLELCKRVPLRAARE